MMFLTSDLWLISFIADFDLPSQLGSLMYLFHQTL